MIRFLAYSHDDYVAKMVKLFDHNMRSSPEEIESFLGVEFAMKDASGKTAFISDCDRAYSENPASDELLATFAYWEWQAVDTSVFRINSPGELPRHYPALVLAWIDDDHDRTGAVSARIVEFVYQSEFNPASNKE